VARLLRAATGVANLDEEAARTKVRKLMPGADAQDVLLLDDLLGISDPEVPLHPSIRMRGGGG
jgi:hypothetical protein